MGPPASVVVPDEGQGVGLAPPDPRTSEATSSNGSCHDPWDAEYERSALWKERWDATQDETAPWPEGVRLCPGRMIWDGRVCVPETKVQPVLKSIMNLWFTQECKGSSKR